MKRALLVFAIAGSGMLAGAQQPAPTTTASASGRVLDGSTGRPIEGAIVALRRSSTTMSVTDRDGRYRINELTPGDYQAGATASGYLDGWFGQRRPSSNVGSLRLSAGQRRDDVDILLWRPAIVSGRVLDDTGEPVAGVGVTAILRREFDRPTGSFGTRAFTDDRGGYELALPPGDYVILVAVNHITWLARDTASSIIPGAQWLAFHRVLSSDGRFTLQVENGLAVPASSMPGTPRTFVTTFHPSVSARREAQTIAVAGGDALTGIDLRLQTAPHRQVIGRAVDEHGQPLAQVVLRAIPDDAPRAPDFQELSAVRASGAVDGAFTFLRIPPGSYTVHAYRMIGDGHTYREDRDGYWARMPLVVAGRDLSGLTVRLMPGVEVRGTIVIDGAPPSRGGTTVRLFDRNGQGSGATDTGTGPGQFQLTGVRPDRYLIVPSLPQGYVPVSLTHAGLDVLDVPVDVGVAGLSGLVLTISDRRTLITGTVSGPDGKPAAGTFVGILPAAEPDRTPFGERRLRVQLIETDATGTFRAPDLPPGAYIVAAMSEDEREDWPYAKIAEELARRGTPVTLSSGATQHVTLRLVSR